MVSLCLFCWFSTDPPILVFPFQVEEPLPPELGLALTFFCEDEHRFSSSFVPFSRLREELANHGLSSSFPIPYAKRQALARALGAAVFVWGTLKEDGAELGIGSSDGWQPPQFARLRCAPLMPEFLNLFLVQLGFPEAPPAGNRPGLEFYAQAASIPFLSEEASMVAVFKRLEGTQPGNGLLRRLFQRHGSYPAALALPQPDRLFWRDFALDLGNLAQAYRYSSAMLEEKIGAEEYLAHAEILLRLGRGDLACTYARMAQAYGAILGAELMPLCSPGAAQSPPDSGHRGK
jgi:hypothetical protein